MPTDRERRNRERRNIELAYQWADFWNNEVDSMVAESYAPDCVAVNMYVGGEVRGREELHKVEHAMVQIADKRRMDIRRTIASGDDVVVAADITWGDRISKACIILTFNEAGQITIDHCYGEDPSGTFTPGSQNFIGRAV